MMNRTSGETEYGTTSFRTAASDRRVVPWLNGRGTTQVVAATDQWRVSIAEEPTESRFSVIDGVDRLITPIGSVSLELIGPSFVSPPGSVDAVTVVRHVVEPLHTLAFPGEWAPASRASSRTRALNVMGRRGEVDMSVEIGPSEIPDRSGSVRICLDLVTEDALIVPPGELMPPVPPRRCAIISISRTGPQALRVSSTD
ncbi:HutD family protein [Rhodococcus daqingensis]|uniref:HutD family protein n=1 Tax=Rhodococcus daqingensis TaxID=2479363 RepID=A0ABW2S4U3_9NOCA